MKNDSNKTKITSEFLKKLDNSKLDYLLGIVKEEEILDEYSEVEVPIFEIHCPKISNHEAIAKAKMINSTQSGNSSLLGVSVGSFELNNMLEINIMQSDEFYAEAECKVLSSYMDFLKVNQKISVMGSTHTIQGYRIKSLSTDFTSIGRVDVMEKIRDLCSRPSDWEQGKDFIIGKSNSARGSKKTIMIAKGERKTQKYSPTIKGVKLELEKTINVKNTISLEYELPSGYKYTLLEKDGLIGYGWLWKKL